MEDSFLEFELDFFRNFFSTAGDDDNESNYNTVIHQKSILSPYSIGICLCYLISMIKSSKIREKVAKELFSIELDDFLNKKISINRIENNQSNKADLFIKEVFKLILQVEDHKNIPNANELLSSLTNINSILPNAEENNNTAKRKFYSANFAFSVISPSLLSPESEFFQNSDFIHQIDYTNNSVYKIINKAVKKHTFGNIHDLMNPLMHFTDNSIALSSLLYFEDSFHEDYSFDSIELHIFHTFTANNRRRKSTMGGPKSVKCQHNECHNLCLSCQKSEQKLMSSSQSFTALYQHSTSSVKVQMMKMIGKKPLCNDKSKNYFAIEIPTSDYKFSLVCVIPRYRGEESFSGLIQSMTHKEFHSILNNMEPSSFDIYLPIFSFNTESFDLISPLSEFESIRIFKYNNEIFNSSNSQFGNLSNTSKSQPDEVKDHKVEQKESKKKKKQKSKDKKKKKGSTKKIFIKENNDEHVDSIVEKDIPENSTPINNENINNHNYFYCPHCGTRKIKNDSMIGQECMIKNIKLNEDAFLHHFRQKCHFSIDLNGICQTLSSHPLPRSSSISSWTSSSSLSSHSTFDSNPKFDVNVNNDSERLITKDAKTKGKEKKKKENQPKKIFDHPFIFFLTRRKPDIIVQYGVVTLPTLEGESFPPA